MRKSKLGFAITACLLCLLMALCGCSGGLKYGFEHEWMPFTFACAVKSKKTVFDINNVTLDFYFGSWNNDGSTEWDKISDKNYELVGILIYFINQKEYQVSNILAEVVDDYRNYDGYYFVKLINEEEYTSGSYNTKQTLLFGKKFKHHELLTVPKEIFKPNQPLRNSFYFVIVSLYYSKKDIGYWMAGIGELQVLYELIDEHTVRLSTY